MRDPPPHARPADEVLQSFGVERGRGLDDARVAEVRTRAGWNELAEAPQLFFSLSCRSDRYTMPELGPFTNRWLFAAIAVSGVLQMSIVLIPIAQKVFETHVHGLYEWETLFVLSLVPVTVVEVGKLVWKAVRRGATSAAASS